MVHLHGFRGNKNSPCSRHLYGFCENRRIVHVVGTCMVLWKLENGPGSRNLCGFVETGEWSMWCVHVQSLKQHMVKLIC